MTAGTDTPTELLLFLLRNCFTSDEAHYTVPFPRPPPAGHIRSYFVKIFFWSPCIYVFI